MRLFVLIITLGLLTSCKAQNKNDMKTFNIEIFEKNKDHLNHYTFSKEDGTIVEQNRWQFGYEEVITKKDSSIKTYYKYYENGNLKLIGDFFPNDFEKGIWKEYDEQGNLIKETDYDTPYKFTWEDILAFIKEKEIDMNGDHFEVGRNVVENKPVWSIFHNIENSDLINVIGIDGNTGEVFQENTIGIPMEDDDIDSE